MFWFISRQNQLAGFLTRGSYVRKLKDNIKIITSNYSDR